MRTAPRSQLTNVALLLVASSCLLFSACSPSVYKYDIATFSKGVDDTAEAFDALSAQTLAKNKSLKFEDFAANKDVIIVSQECTSSVTDGRLVNDTRCLAAWAAYRAAPEGKRTKPA